MAEDQNELQPIIIRRKKHGGHGAHSGAWKVAFADFMTAMMAFFLVMWLVGQKDEVKQAVAGYFRDPGKFDQTGQSGVLKGSPSALKTEAVTTTVVNPPQEKTYLPSEEERSRLSLAARTMLEELNKHEVFQQLKDNVKIQLTSEGLRIILNESENSPAFFEPGSAKLLQQSAIILVTIAKELGTLHNHVVIEGHTDNSAAADRQYSNWELSADRANSARQLMEVSGLYEGQVREVRGFADRFPMITENPADSRNRRISLVVLYQAKEAQFDEIQVGENMSDMITGG